ncbi:antitoxin [Rhizobium herbae]|jgi:antitoxin VapB
MTERAKVFQSGNSQAVRLPKEFRFDVDELEITREGDAVILRPLVKNKQAWSGLKAAMARGFSEDFMADGRQQPEIQDNPDLKNLFR